MPDPGCCRSGGTITNVAKDLIGHRPVALSPLRTRRGPLLEPAFVPTRATTCITVCGQQDRWNRGRPCTVTLVHTTGRCIAGCWHTTAMSRSSNRTLLIFHLLNRP